MVSLHQLKEDCWSAEKNRGFWDTQGIPVEVTKRIVLNFDDARISIHTDTAGTIDHAILEQPNQPDARIIHGWLYEFCVWVAQNN